MHVPNRVVATKATRLRFGCSGVWTFNSVDYFLMTLPACFFSYLASSWCDLDVVVEPSRREVIGMPETILCFGCVLADQSRWGMAIVANRH